MIKNLTLTEMIIEQPKIVCVPYFSDHGELHLNAKIKNLNR